MAKKTKRGGYHPASGKRSSRSLWIGAGAGALAAIVVVAGVLAFTGGDDGPEQTSGHQAPVVIASTSTTVDIVDNGFKPKDIIVRPGTKVTWLNKGSLPHDVTEQPTGDREPFASDTLQKGDTFVRDFATPGDYYYYCTIHHAMLGSVVVKP